MTTGDISSNGPSEATKAAANLIINARRAALATLHRTSVHPYVSLVTIAIDNNGWPLMLLSRLAKHTQNLEANPRASLLFEAPNVNGADPLASARVTVMGLASPTSSTTARARFLTHHPDAEMYASFSDFAFYAFATHSAHFIGGFGRIFEIPGPALTAAIHAADS